MARSKYRQREQSLPPADRCESILAEKVDDDSEPYQLGPAKGKSAEQFHREFATQRIYNIHSDEETPERGKFQFSLRELFFVTTLACVALAVATWMPLYIFTFLAGILALLGLLLALFHPPQSRWMRLAWCTLLGTYLVLALVAGLRVWNGV